MISSRLCRIALAIVLSAELAGPAWGGTMARNVPDIRAAYEPELFELAYSVFMANSSLPEALAVAERSLEALPDDKAWRERAAQVSEWNNLPHQAFGHWLRLADGGDRKAGLAALRLSRAINEMPQRKRLLEQMLSEGGNDFALLTEYLEVAENLGMPEDAYKMATSGWVSGHDGRLLAEQARLAETLGRPADSVAAWQQLARLAPLNTSQALKLASLYYNQGDLDQAWQTLNKTAQNAPPEATVFWRTYTDLAWARQETDEAARVSRMLLNRGHASEIDYQRLILVYQPKDPQQAQAIALAGWQRFKRPVYWYALAETALRTGNERMLISMIKSFSPDEIKVLERDARAQMLMARLHRQSGDIRSCLADARAALRLEPDSGEILSSYLWLQIDLQQTDELRRLVRDWEWRIIRIPELREPLAAAMMMLGYPSRALRIYRVLAPERQEDPSWLASYADVLEQAGYPEAAWPARRRAQSMLAERLKTPGASAESARQDLLTKAQLLLHLAPGDALKTAIRRIADGRQDDISRGLVMGWAMASGETDLARFWNWRALAGAAQRMDWASLGLALEENDRSAIADLIETRLDRLPYRDAVEGARRSGRTLLAETLAFEQFQLNDTDHLLYKQLKDLYQGHPAAFRQRLTLQEQGGIGFLEEATSFSYPLNNRLAISAEWDNADIRHRKSGVLGKYPSSIQSAWLGLQLKHEKGNTRLSAGLTDALYRFYSYELYSDWHPYNRLLLDLGLRYGWPASESVPLRIGGLKDEISAGVLLALTPRDNLSGRLTFRELRDQERRRLGNGLSIEAEATHKLLVDWPDSNLRLFSGFHRFSGSGTLSGRTLEMNPGGDAANNGFYIPRSFALVGGGINFGQFFRNSYGRQWLPFCGIDLSWSSVSGSGFRYELGMAGPLFGLDKLEGAVSQESGRFGSSEVNTRFDIRYLYNLN